jgi:hypothetical protein
MIAEALERSKSEGGTCNDEISTPSLPEIGCGRCRARRLSAGRDRQVVANHQAVDIKVKAAAMGAFFKAVADTVVAIGNAVASVFIGERGHPQAEPSPPLELRITSISSATPSPGTDVTIQWDYVSPEMLQMQTVLLHTLAFDGRFATYALACVPGELLPPGDSQTGCVPMSLGQRSFSFPFKGPVTFQLTARDHDGNILQKFIKLRLPNRSFSLTIESGSALSGSPRMPGTDTSDGKRVIEFDTMYGIYESTTPHDVVVENGVIDHLEGPSFKPVFSGDAHFFMTSHSSRESEHFNSSLGRTMPKLTTEFLRSPEGAQFQGTRQFADTVLLAMALGVDGSVEVMNTTDGKPCEVITSTIVKGLEPIFVQIDLRSKPGQTDDPVVSNIHIGNVPQGLVLASYHDSLSFQSPRIPAPPGGISIVKEQNSTRRITGGQIDKARVANNVIATGTTQSLPRRSIVSLAWSNVPIDPDTDLDPLLAEQFVLP